MHELQILGDELDIDQPAGGIFEIPAVVVALLFGDRLAHFGDVARNQLGVARAAQHAADHLLDARGELRRR